MSVGLIPNIDRMASTRRDTVWHAPETERDGRLVVVARTGDNEQDLLRLLGIVLPVDADNDVAGTVPLVTATGTPVASHLATVSPSGRILGIVTAGYEPVAMRVVATEWALALARAGGAVETAGTFNAGANFFLSFQVADAWRVPGDHSETRPLLNITGNHAGLEAIRAAFAGFRVVCKNTDAMFAREHDGVTDAAERAARAWVSIRHTANAVDRMREAVAWIVDGRARAESEKAMLARLASKLVSAAEVTTFVDSYISIPADATDRTKGIREDQRAAFGRTLRDVSDLGNHAWTGKSMSAYGLLQAVTHFEDYVSRVQSPNQPVASRRAFRAFLGERQAEKTAARDLILALVK